MLISSLLTSIVATIVSNPFDVLFTQIAAASSSTTIFQAYSQVGVEGLFSGLSNRVAATSMLYFFTWYWLILGAGRWTHNLT